MRPLLPLILLLACSSPAPAPAEKHDDHDAHEDHEGHSHDHDPAAHGHGAAHGGQQRELNGMHAEALFQADGVRFYLTDGDDKPIDPRGILGSAVVTGPDGVHNVDLMAMGEALHAPVKLETGKPAKAVLTFAKDGGAQSALFDTTAVGTALHDHTALHGGDVAMWGNFHVELLARDGVYRVWVTDASRGPVAGAVSGVVVDGQARLPLVAEPGPGALSAAAEGAGTRPVTVELSVDGLAFTVPFQPVKTP